MSTTLEVQRICEYCGKEFTARTTKTRYCSHTCNSRAYKLTMKNAKVELSNREVQQIRNKPIEELKAKEFLNVRQTSLLIGCSRQTIYTLINTGKLKAVNIKIKKTIVSRSEINKLLGI